MDFNTINKQSTHTVPTKQRPVWDSDAPTPKQPVEHEAEEAATDKADEPKVCFVNDPTAEQKEAVLSKFTAKMKETLDQPTLTVNAVSRLLNRAFPSVSKAQSRDNRLSSALDTFSTGMAKARSALQNLTPAERALLLQSIKQ